MILNKIYNEDCLETMKRIPDNAIDLVLTDPPYGTTACAWDSIIPLDKMWEQLLRIAKPSAAILIFSSQPFTTKLIFSNIDLFKYELIWEKNVPTGMVLANKRPMKYHENICVFFDQQPTYNKQLQPREWKTQPTVDSIARRATADKHSINNETQDWKTFSGKLKNPSSILKFDCVPRATGTYHTTQKPVALIKYLVETYSNSDELVLDFAMGSGTTALACKDLGRNYIGSEISAEYCEIAESRLAQGVLDLFTESVVEQVEGLEKEERHE